MSNVRTIPSKRIADWALSLIVCPFCKRRLPDDSVLVCEICGPIGNFDKRILRFSPTVEDASVTWYRRKGGTHFFERNRVPYAMSSLDTPLYHHYLADIRPKDMDAVVIDIGAGDGRNTTTWLEWGFERIIAVDAVFASLARFQERLESERPDWLERIVMIECDARRLPLAASSVETAFAIESLYYLNEDYTLGLAECRRILKHNGKLLLSERSWEGALLTRLLYGGVEAMLSLSQSRDMLDGPGDDLVRSRCFTEQELITLLCEHGFAPLEIKGVPVLALVLGYLQGGGKLKPRDQGLLPQVHALIRNLGNEGLIRRTHVVVAEKLRRL